MKDAKDRKEELHWNARPLKRPPANSTPVNSPGLNARVHMALCGDYHILTPNGPPHFGLHAPGLANQSASARLYSAAWPYTSRDQKAGLATALATGIRLSPARWQRQASRKVTCGTPHIS